MIRRKERNEKRAPLLLNMLREIRENKCSFTVFLLLACGILALIAHGVWQGDWNRVFTGTLTLLLLLIPAFVERNFRIRLPTTLEILAYVFVFCAGILGEIAGFYEKFPFWDDMLHAFNGYMFAAVGFCLVELSERSRRRARSYSPFLITFVAFCFSMTVGALWELFEYGTDMILGTDMQKDTFITELNTVTLPNTTGERVTHIEGIARTIIETNDGERVVFWGYLDVGLIDTMMDIWVNLLGALVFCLIGYVYLHRRQGGLAEQFIPVVVKEGEN